MRITQLDDEAIQQIPFLNAGKRPGGFTTEFLPVLHGIIEGLPKSVDALIAAGDLQGRETFKSSKGQPPRLLGEVIPSANLVDLVSNLGLNPKRCGVVLAGDLYSVPALDRRGGLGDVTEVWRAFGDEFAWVVGVAGNHDNFESICDKKGRPRFRPPLHFLNSECVEVGDIRIGGVSGVIGNPRRIWRYEEEDYCENFFNVITSGPDLVVMHDGPDGSEKGQIGASCVRKLMLETRPALIVRGHAHWNNPLGNFACGHQILNVDQRVAILTR